MQLEKACFPIDWTVVGIANEVSEQQLLNAFSPIEVNPSNVMSTNEQQFSNALFGIACKDLWNLTWLRKEQFEKVPTPIEVTDIGISIFVSEWQSENA